MASALSFNGVQVVLMIMLPALGWAVVAAGASALATILVVAAPLLLIDSDAMMIVVTDRLLGYYLIAAVYLHVNRLALGVADTDPTTRPGQSDHAPGGLGGGSGSVGAGLFGLFDGGASWFLWRPSLCCHARSS